MGKFEYKAIRLGDPAINTDHVEDLNDRFDSGWEFHETITQQVATGSTCYLRGAVIIILKREKDNGISV